MLHKEGALRFSLGVGLIALTFVACSDDKKLGSVDLLEVAEPPSVTPPVDPVPGYDVAACRTCLETRCTTERVRCLSVAGCVAIANCATNVNCNQECINRCFFNQTGFGRREYEALGACEFNAACGPCKEACGASPLCTLRSESDPNAPPAKLNSCGDCARERCAGEVEKCAPGTPCDEYFACTKPCPESARPPCVAVSDQSHPVGRADGEALVECSKTACEAQCVF